MPDLIRLSLSIEKPLYDQLERMVKKSGYSNRSEYVRDMIRQRLVEEQWDKDAEVLGSITLVYDHHRRQLAEKLTEIGHDHHHNILVTTHLHMTKHLCAEVIVVKGKAHEVRRLADQMKQQKGVLHAELSMTSTGKELH